MSGVGVGAAQFVFLNASDTRPELNDLAILKWAHANHVRDPAHVRPVVPAC